MNPRESNPAQLSLRFQGDRAISHAVNAARAFGEAQQLEDDELARLCIVVEELVANLYDHGGLSKEDEIELGLALGLNGIRISISDGGCAFDPWSGAQTDYMTGGSGAGVSLVRAWAELISYHSSNERNYLELLVPFRRKN